MQSYLSVAPFQGRYVSFVDGDFGGVSVLALQEGVSRTRCILQQCIMLMLQAWLRDEARPSVWGEEQQSCWRGKHLGSAHLMTRSRKLRLLRASAAALMALAAMECPAIGRRKIGQV